MKTKRKYTIKTPKEKMLKYMKMNSNKQYKHRVAMWKTMEKFLQTATIEDLGILNQFPGGKISKRTGMLLSAENIILLGAYGERFFNKGKS